MLVLSTRVPLAIAFTTILVVACGSSDNGGVGNSGGAGSGIACDATTASTCGGRKCDAAIGCVDCVLDTDCGAGSPFCISGKCESCRTNADCGVAAPACWPRDGKCHAACTTNAGCPKDEEICDTGTGACVGCRANADCAAPKAICNAIGQRCVECGTNTDCPATAPRCAVAAGKCAQCLSNADCGVAAPVCDLDDFRCKAAPVCTTDAQCAAPTPICDTDRCVQCKDDKDCPATASKCRGKACVVP